MNVNLLIKRKLTKPSTMQIVCARGFCSVMSKVQSKVRNDITIHFKGNCLLLSIRTEHDYYSRESLLRSLSLEQKEHFQQITFPPCRNVLVTSVLCRSCWAASCGPPWRRRRRSSTGTRCGGTWTPGCSSPASTTTAARASRPRSRAGGRSTTACRTTASQPATYR